MENKDMPAMPFEDSGFGQYKPEVYYGLTKREMFAMNAPDVPDWFGFDWESKNSHNKEYKIDCRFELLPKGQMALLKAWRYAYADLMLEDLR